MRTLSRPRTDDVPARRPTGDRVRYAAVRLVPSAVLLWALLAGLGYVLTRWVTHTAFARWDLSVDRWFVQHRSPSWNLVTQVGSHAAETYTVIAIGVVLVVGLRVVLGRWRESLFLAVAVVGEVTIFVCTTLVIDRPRPAVPRLDVAPPTSSFPSGHVAAAVALYGAFAVVVWLTSRHGWLRAAAAVLAVAVPVAVGISRLSRGMHYPTDVLAGALLGVLWLTAATLVLLRNRW
jgi:membrane-associated phospholipid phosphatase